MTTPTCTWEYCMATATCPQLSDDGRPWANLCETHHTELKQAAARHIAGSGAPQAALRAWVAAQGGHKAAAVARTILRRKP